MATGDGGEATFDPAGESLSRAFTTRSQMVRKTTARKFEEEKLQDRINELAAAKKYWPDVDHRVYDGSDGKPAITFWQKKITHPETGNEIDNPRPIRIKFSVGRFDEIDPPKNSFGISLTCIFNYPMAQDEYEHYREWEKEQWLAEARGGTREESYKPKWCPEARAENKLEENAGVLNEGGYGIMDPWGEKRPTELMGGRFKGQFIHQEIDQPWAADEGGGKDKEGKVEKLNRHASSKLKEKVKAKRRGDLGYKEEKNFKSDDDMLWHEKAGNYPYVSFKVAYSGTFSEGMEVENFPFDCQDMSVSFKDQKKAKECYYMPNNLGKCKFKWKPDKQAYEVGKYKAPENFGKIVKNTSSIVGWTFYRGLVEFTNTDPRESSKGDKYPRMVLRFKFARQWMGDVVSLYIPVLIIWMLTIMTWLIDPMTYDREGRSNDYYDGGGPVEFAAVQAGAAGDRLAYLSGLLLTVVAFFPAIQDRLPSVPYLTWIDEYVTTCMIFIFLAAVFSCMIPAPGLITQRGVWQQEGDIMRFQPIDENCCFQAPAFQKWVKLSDDDQVAQPLSDTRTFEYLNYGEDPDGDFADIPYWTERNPTYVDNYVSGWCKKVFEPKGDGEYDNLTYPQCLGNAGYIMYVDMVVFYFFVGLSFVVNVLFLLQAFWYRKKELQKLTSDSIMLAEMEIDPATKEANSGNLYGHMAADAQRWYPPGIPSMNHGEEMEVYLIARSYIQNKEDPATGDILHKRGDFIKDSQTENFSNLSEKSLAKIRASELPLEVKDGKIHFASGDMMQLMPSQLSRRDLNIEAPEGSTISVKTD